MAIQWVKKLLGNAKSSLDKNLDISFWTQHSRALATKKYILLPLQNRLECISRDLHHSMWFFKKPNDIL